jgi:CYTH domain-containing protein
MATEIEYKYLIDLNAWKKVKPIKSIEINQAYLLTNPEKTIRVRTKGSKGYFTIKGKSFGASRAEYEYEIPVDEAKELISKFCDNSIQKIRHEIKVGNHIWEVDEFLGNNDGLFVAEIELNAENENFELPNWVTENVTLNQKYANSNLSLNPFCNWEK